MKRIIPDYCEIDKIFVVSPISVRNDLWEEFQHFIKILTSIIYQKNKNQKIVIVCESEEAKNLTEQKLELSKDIQDRTLIFEICKVLDIWIRDFFICANIKNLENKSEGVKAIYSPSYNSLSSVDDAAGVVLSQKYFDEQINLPLKLDGGNVICNSKYLFISEKLYTENFHLSKFDIDTLIEKTFYQKLITLPTEILDVVGHTDCILRFLDDKTILLPIYDAEYKVDNRYIMNIRKKVIESLGIDYDIIFIPSFLDDSINEDNIFSAKGLFLNYFRFEDCIIFPSFESLNNYEVEITRIINKINPSLKIYFSPCDKISFNGGCFNCITNVKYKI